MENGTVFFFFSLSFWTTVEIINLVGKNMIENSLSLVTSSMRVTFLEEPVNTWVLWNFIKNKRSKALPWLLRAEPETCRPRPGQWPRHTLYWLMAVEELRHSEANPWDHTGEWVHVAASRYSALIDDVVSLVVQPILCNVKEQRPIQRGMVLNPSPNPLLAPSCPVRILWHRRPLGLSAPSNPPSVVRSEALGLITNTIGEWPWLLTTPKPAHPNPSHV